MKGECKCILGFDLMLLLQVLENPHIWFFFKLKLHWTFKDAVGKKPSALKTKPLSFTIFVVCITSLTIEGEEKEEEDSDKEDDEEN
uniref:Uncharacterized protein n=1 Tax=Tanacetum cinerariifolium TaxID=118510 RepID=A0A6L2M318_TANCI|nr:hypothetical protein [Tanacetum cinerariifolium]